jgi:Tol biopolymer transport system component
MKRKILVFIGLILAVWTQAVGKLSVISVGKGKLSVISLLAMVLLGLLMPGLIESMNTLMSQTRAGCAKTPQKAQITFVSDRDGNPKSYIMDADGENQRRFITTNNLVWTSMEAWSPDDKMIAFITDRDGNYEIYVMDANGKNPRNLTNNPAFDTDPAWSPDGKMIAFFSNRGGTSGLYVMDAPAWSPDGKMIAFNAISNRDENSGIYVMDADGKNQRRLTNNPTLDCGPIWFDPAVAHPVSPVGKQTIWDMIKQLFSR